ncbi:MAG: hypothetical protein FD167_3407, partial [bacterium]
NLSVLISFLRKEFDTDRLPIVVVGDNEPPVELASRASFLSQSFTSLEFFSSTLEKQEKI